LKVKDQGHKVIQLQGSDVHLERLVTGGHGWPMQILRSEAEIKRTDYFSVWYRSWRLCVHRSTHDSVYEKRIWAEHHDFTSAAATCRR